MKEFMKTVKQTFQVDQGELGVYGITAFVSGILGIIIMVIIMEAAGEDEYLAMGGLMAIMISVLLLVFGGIFSLLQDFNLAISFGKTRKHYIPAKYILTLANCMMCVLVAVLIGLFEKFFYARLYPEARALLSVDFLFDYPAFTVGFVLLIPMLIMLLGALFAKFGMKFFWVCWVLWMLSFTVLPKMISASIHEQDSVLGKIGSAFGRFFTGLNEMQGIALVFAAGIGGVVIAFLILRKQRVAL